MKDIERNSTSFSIVHLLIFFNLILSLVSFIKDIVFASYFGTTEIADTISLAFFLPDTLGNNLIGAALAVTSIPVLTKLFIYEEHILFQNTVQKICTFIFFGTFLISILLFLFSKSIFEMFHLNNNQNFSLVYDYFLLIIPIVCFAPLWLFGSSILQASRHFILPAFTPILFNLFLLICLLFLKWGDVSQIHGGRTFSMIITISTFSVCSITWYVIFRNKKIKFRWSFFYFNTDDFLTVKKIFLSFFPYFFLLFFSQGSLFVERYYASLLESGTIAALTYAYRISQFPLWVFIAAINTFILPTISLHLEKRDIDALKRDLYKSFVLVIGISGVISFILVIFSEPLLSIFLARDSFTIDSVKLTSSILKGYGLSIVGQSLYVFCTRYFVAEEAIRVPLLIGFVGFLLNITLLFVFVPNYGARGIGYAVSLSSSISGIWILICFIKKLMRMERKEGDTFE